MNRVNEKVKETKIKTLKTVFVQYTINKFALINIAVFGG